ncbi:hypothetical protein COCON_G00168540 [Conger conger]|uniref:Gypsy retrotransposon integrase-like protein 1 n=1 Tax=Conger conger TaxID=82655 RepID=A0A9Q1D7D6_CONCO|nr:hypothetical protein COCON_G00168540 [Conger conger]
MALRVCCNRSLVFPSITLHLKISCPPSPAGPLTHGAGPPPQVKIELETDSEDNDTYPRLRDLTVKASTSETIAFSNLLQEGLIMSSDREKFKFSGKRQSDCDANSVESLVRYKHVYRYITKGVYSKHLPEQKKRGIRRSANNFSVEEGRLYYVGPKKEEKREVVIDTDKKRKVFLDCHFDEIGHHLGQKKTVNRIQSKYYWLGIVKDVVDWIKLCETCQQTERSKNMSRTIRPIKVEAPWEVVGIDMLGPFPETCRGNTYVVILTDYLSKWVEAFPVQKKDPLCVARCISSAVYRFGSLKTVFCSQSTDFCDEVTQQLCDRWSVAQRVSPLEPSRLNGLCDRSGGLLREALWRAVAEKQAEWDDYLDPILFFFRTSVNPNTKFTPYYLIFSREAVLPGQREPDLLTHQQGQEVTPVQEESVTSIMASMQEQQTAVRQLVIANMSSAYKQGKKEAKQRGMSMPTVTLKVTDSLLDTVESPPPTLPKENHYLMFPAGAILTTEQNGFAERKTEFEIPVLVSGIQ